MASTIPTIEELQAKANDCREEARSFQNPAIRENLLAIALEYDRLARRAEEYEARPSEFALRHWYQQP